MRWKTKPMQQLGDQKVRLRFAVWPVRCANETMVWLEFFTEEYKLVHTAFGGTYWRFEGRRAGRIFPPRRKVG